MLSKEVSSRNKHLGLMRSPRLKSNGLGPAELCRWCSGKSKDDFSAAVLLSKLAGVAGNLAFYALSVQEQIDLRARAYSAAKSAELAHDELGHGAQLAYLYFSTGNADLALNLIDELIARNEVLIESPGDAKLDRARRNCSLAG